MAETMDETENLRQELEHYRAEKERVRKIIGQIGGSSSKSRDRLINAVFLILVLILFCFDLGREIFHFTVAGIPPLLAMEMAMLLLSLKIIWMIHCQTKVDHFQFWVLNSIEYQINLMSKRIRDIEEDLKQSGSSGR
jgi:hypothetical protein